jgi:2-(1,2-epoxy-1,2-dihydrophenyl)acetyl-CoA isomerase
MRRRTISADEASALGLATSVVPAGSLADEASKLAHDLAAGPTAAYAAIKLALAYSAVHTLEESLHFEGEMMRVTGATLDHHNAVAAFQAKQSPTFDGH